MAERILVDFDGTVVEKRFPEIGRPMPKAFEVLAKLKEAGFKLILWTCREDTRKRRYLSEAVEFCRANGIEFDAVNETIREFDFREDGLARKPHAEHHIDDHNIGGFPGWEWVESVLLKPKLPNAKYKN